MGESEPKLTEMDRAANLFAMHLLMPTHLLRKYMPKGLALDDDAAIAKLARRFAVPASVMAIRLGMLVEDDRSKARTHKETI